MHVDGQWCKDGSVKSLINSAGVGIIDICIPHIVDPVR